MVARARRARRRQGGDANPRPGEVYLEYMPVGEMLRVAAVDAASGLEVTVFGPASLPREDFARVAQRKLSRRLEASRSPAVAASGGAKAGPADLLV